MGSGMAAKNWALRHRRHWFGLKFEGAGRFLALLDRWSLSYYLLHQAVLMGLLMVIAALRKTPDGQRQFPQVGPPHDSFVKQNSGFGKGRRPTGRCPGRR